MDRILERAFAKAYGGQLASEVGEKRPRGTGVIEDIVEEPPASAPDAIQKILKAWQDKDYFRLLGLPDPTVDELGRPVWPFTSSDVSRAYRRLSVLVHPDKNPGDDARRAFEALNDTHRLLKDASSMETILREAATKAKQQQERAEARATAAERIHLNSSRNTQARVLRKEQGKDFQEEIVRQMRKRQELALRKGAASTWRGRSDGEAEGVSTAGRDERQPAPARGADQPSAHAGRHRTSESAGIAMGQRNDASDDEDARQANTCRNKQRRKKPVFI